MILLVNGQSQGSSFVQWVLGAITNPITLVILITVVAVPLLNAALTSQATHPLFRTALTAVLTGAMAVGAWASNLGNVVVDWKAAVMVFFTAIGAMGGLRNTLLKGPIEDAFQKLPIALGPKVVSSSGADATTPYDYGYPRNANAERSQ